MEVTIGRRMGVSTALRIAFAMAQQAAGDGCSRGTPLSIRGPGGYVLLHKDPGREGTGRWSCY